jgi:hypothetical protein
VTTQNYIREEFQSRLSSVGVFNHAVHNFYLPSPSQELKIRLYKTIIVFFFSFRWGVKLDLLP